MSEKGPSADEPFAIDDTTAAVPGSGDELDGARIRQVAMLRRATARSRSHALVFVGLFAVAAVQLVILVVNTARTGLGGRWEIGLALTAIACGWLAVIFWKKSRRLKDAYSRSALEEPSAPPDLSTLSDGSQRWKNLEEMR